MCVQRISAQCVLQFTPSLAAGCVLHRPENRVIHRLESCSFGFQFSTVKRKVSDSGYPSRSEWRKLKTQLILCSVSASLSTRLLVKTDSCLRPGSASLSTNLFFRKTFAVPLCTRNICFSSCPAIAYFFPTFPSCNRLPQHATGNATGVGGATPAVQVDPFSHQSVQN